MSDVRVQIVLHTTDANPANYITNSWCLKNVSPGSDDAAIKTLFKDFYDDISASYWSSSIAQNGHDIKLSLLPGFEPNYPYYESTWNLSSVPAGSPLPSECAIALSFQGFRSAGLPQARRRGRVFLGPWGTTANTSGRPTAALNTLIANAAISLLSTSIALADPDGGLAVWSVADSLAVQVDNGWVDNAWDIQRRRGLEYTSRTLWA